jgi:hypothetical protein
MTKIHLTFWREEHKADDNRPGVISVIFKPFSDRIAGYTLIEAKNESELKAEIARHLDQIKTHLATLAAEEYGADGYVKPSLSIVKGPSFPSNRKFANFDEVARKVCKHFCFNASIYLANIAEREAIVGAVETTN